MAWSVNSIDVADMAAGCAILGSGGGGETHPAVVALQALIGRGLAPQVINAEELPDDALIVSVGYLGAPITLQEKLLTEAEILPALKAAETCLNRRIDALVATEIGGFNGMVPMLAGALSGIPAVDADGMGRAFPQSDHVTFSIYGLSSAPTILCGEQGDIAIVQASSNLQAERISRAVCTTLGSKVFGIDYPMTRQNILDFAVPQTLSLARELGAAVKGSRAAAMPVADAVRHVLAKRGLGSDFLFEGSVVDYSSTTTGGFGIGKVVLRDAAGQSLDLDFQNEFLVARVDGRPVAATPDILSLVDAESLQNIGSDAVRYGQRVKLLRIDAPSLMTTPKALRVIGPRAFGYDFDALLENRGRGVPA